MTWLNKLANGYGKFLSRRVGPGDNPAPIYVWVLIFCPTALLTAFVLWLPVQTALQHGVPLSGKIHTVNKHGVPKTDSIQSIISIDVPILVVCLPLLLSTVAYLAGWLGRFRDDEADIQNIPRRD